MDFSIFIFIFSRFHSFNEPWYLHEDRQFYYDVQTNGGRFLSNWDWIGLYKENFTSLDEYKGYLHIKILMNFKMII